LNDVSSGLVGFLLAQDAGGAAGGGGAGAFGLWPAVIVSLIAMYLLMIRPERAREKELKARLENLKKNDRVLTASGIYGVVMNVRREVDEVTLKIDEDTGAKLRCTMRSIARVLESAE
jgi:preprotein translocase subunit YajC